MPSDLEEHRRSAHATMEQSGTSLSPSGDVHSGVEECPLKQQGPVRVTIEEGAERGLAIGGALTLHAGGLVPARGGEVSWSVIDGDSHASVEASGEVRGTAEGTALVAVTHAFDGVKAMAVIRLHVSSLRASTLTRAG